MGQFEAVVLDRLVKILYSLSSNEEDKSIFSVFPFLCRFFFNWLKHILIYMKAGDYIKATSSIYIVIQLQLRRILETFVKQLCAIIKQYIMLKIFLPLFLTQPGFSFFKINMFVSAHAITKSCKSGPKNVINWHSRQDFAFFGFLNCVNAFIKSNNLLCFCPHWNMLIWCDQSDQGNMKDEG